jgi:predicted nuclease of restriction endonuclease-like (RecB) superfamily
MSRHRKAQPPAPVEPEIPGYDAILAGLIELLDSARRAAARAVNAVMTATYWEMGRRIVEHEQRGHSRAAYGKALLARLSSDLTRRVGRGFSVDNLELMRRFYLAYPAPEISETPSRKSGSREIGQTPSGLFSPLEPPESMGIASANSPVDHISQLAHRFPLPWSHYVQLLKVGKPQARAFYEAEALQCGWTVRQLERQITTLFYERTLASRNKAAMLRKGREPRLEDRVLPEEEIKDPLVLEFLDLKDEYSESQLEDALIRHLESFLLELGGDFAFLGRQKRLRVGDEWYRIDLLFYHRRLRALVVIDVKTGKFTHADAGQMHLYLTYAQEHWTRPGENPPVGVILCTQKDQAVVHYALETLPNKVLAAEYRTTLPDEETLAAELERTRRMLDARRSTPKRQEPE